MKKLMIAAAIVCATAMSQAATCSWTVNTSGTLSNPEGVTLTSDISTPMMYIYMTTATAATERNALLVSLKAAAKDGGDASTALSGAWKTVSLANGAFANTEFTTESDAGVKNSFYGIILGADAAGNQYAYFTSTASGNSIAQSEGTTQIAMDGGIATLKDLSTTNAKNGAWYTIAEASDVPEPTSGLLLLLGVAGLALRRKQK